MKHLFSVILLLWLPTYIHSECCPKVTINFYMTDKAKSCSDFNAYYPYPSGTGAGAPISAVIGNLVNGACTVAVCGNGKPAESGHYCGIGPCNMFGCNCDGGCITGNPKDEFLKLHGDTVKNVVYGFLDSIKHHEKSCCVQLFEDASWKGESIEICDCDEKCVNLPDEWKNRISSATLKTSNNLMLYSEEDCNGKELKVPGSTGIVTGSTCRRDLSDDSFFGGCSTTELNDNSKSLKILHRSAFASYVSIIL